MSTKEKLIALLKKNADNDASFIEAIENDQVVSHFYSEEQVDNCAKLGSKGTHAYRLLNTFSHVGYGKEVSVRIADNGYTEILTSTGLCAIKTRDNRYLTVYPLSYQKLLLRYMELTATKQGKKLAAICQKNNSWNIWDMNNH